MEDNEYREFIRPAAGNGAEAYTITLTGQIETRHGIAWTSTLHRNGNLIGTIEDHGDGGAPDVHITSPEERARWAEVLRNSYPETDSMAEEHFIAHLDYTSEGL
jgi:hypothetical protein